MVKRVLRRIGRLIGRGPRPSAAISPIARQVREARLTYLNEGKLEAIETALKDVLHNGVPGAFIECGVALGGSAIVVATWMPKGRVFHGYDVFGMIPPPTSEHDDDKSRARFDVIKAGRSSGIGGDVYYGYVDNLYDRVVDNFARFGHTVDGSHIALHKGMFEDTLHPPEEVAFAHIDCDWYDPVKLCLERIVPRLSRGAHVILDDYNDYGGCRRATDEFMTGARDLEILARAPNFVLRRS
jgi:O-methyltransferase